MKNITKTHNCEKTIKFKNISSDDEIDLTLVYNDLIAAIEQIKKSYKSTKC